MTKRIADVEPINNFMAGGSRHASDLAHSTPATRRTVMPTTARARIAAGKSKRARAVPLGPTPERLDKGDIVRTRGGAFIAESGLDRLHRSFRAADPTKSAEVTKAQAILKRLHHRVALAEDPGMNERMYQAGKRYEELVHIAGLGGISAQNLLSGGGSGDAAHMMPVSESSARARARIRKAWDILPDEAAQAMHGMLVEGRDAESVGRQASMYKQAKECRVAGITLLRIALSMLVAGRWA